MQRAVFALALLMAATPVLAEDFVPVNDRQTFVQMVAGRELRLSLFGIGLKVLPDGRIEGQALGAPVTGTWEWQEGYFCREMRWGAKPIAHNCQLVEARGDEMRFTVDRGAGQAAAFRLR